MYRQAVIALISYFGCFLSNLPLNALNDYNMVFKIDTPERLMYHIKAGVAAVSSSLLPGTDSDFRPYSDVCQAHLTLSSQTAPNYIAGNEIINFMRLPLIDPSRLSSVVMAGVVASVQK